MNGTHTAHKPFRIAIVGGAIGGLSTALLIDHFCKTQAAPETGQQNGAAAAARNATSSSITIDVYEQASEYREIGAGVGLGLNAARLLHTVPGLGARLNEIQGDRGASWFTFVRYDDGRPITHVDGPVTQAEAVVRPLSLARSELLDVLLGLIREREVARLHTKKKFVSVKDLGHNQGVQMTFQDGTTADADLLIGSDGIHSEVRKQFVTGLHALYSGKIAYRGLVPIADLEHTFHKDEGTTWPGQTWAVMWLGRHKHFLVYPVSRDHLDDHHHEHHHHHHARQLNIVAFITKREDEIPDLRESWTSTCDRAELAADFADCAPAVQEVIRLMPARPSKWRINDHEPVPQWTFWDGRVTLLGDACHATTPHQGAGAGQAVEDGYVLARALADWLAITRTRTTRTHGGDDGEVVEETNGNKAATASSRSLRAWMELYQRIRLPRAQKVVVTSRQAGALYEFEQPDLVDLPYDEAVPLVAERLHERMNWIWKEDLDAIYETARDEAGLSASSIRVKGEPAGRRMNAQL